MNNFKIPAIFEKEYIDDLNELNHQYTNSRIIETYGCIPHDLIGSSRVDSQLPQTKIQDLTEYIKYSKDKGIEFDYIMNTTCHGDINHKEFNDILRKQIEMLIEAGVTNITVSTPYMMQYIKQNFPSIKVTASINMCASSVAQVKQLENLGSSRVVLDRNINRNFKLLNSIKNSCNSELELLANSLCLPFCIMHQYHNNLNSHYKDNPDDELLKVYPYAECFSTYISNPILMLCSGWIRPEDLKKYVEIGISRFKIDGRGIPKDIVIEVVKSYMSEYFEGNLFDLMFSGRNTRRSISAFLDNNEVNDFLSNIVDNNIDCRYCGGQNSNCKTLSKKISFNELKRSQFLQQQRQDVESIFKA